MLLREVSARIIEDSRGEQTIAVSVNRCEEASSPNGKSRGIYESKPYYHSLEFCVRFLKDWKENVEINDFEDLRIIEKIICKKLKLKDAKLFGGNALYAFESAILKALAYSKKKQLYEIVGHNRSIPKPIGNVIGGGLHSSMVNKHPNFQEFLIIPKGKTIRKNIKAMNYVYKITRKKLKIRKVNDEGALLVNLNDKDVLDILNRIKIKSRAKFGFGIELGIDAATSSLYKKGQYNYSERKIDKDWQLKFIQELIEYYSLFYFEDPFEEHDFGSFSKINHKVKCLIVGDDLTATHLSRTIKAIKSKSIKAMIIKPNQNGSLLELKKIFELCKKHGVKTILSHRSGETMDDALSDYAVGFGADYIKCGVATKWREVKLERLIEIEKKL
jgi:enolase